MDRPRCGQRVIALDDRKTRRGPFFRRHSWFRAWLPGFSPDLRDPTSRTLPLERRAGWSVKEWDDVWVVVGDRVDIIDTVVVGIVHIGLRFLARRENPAAVLVIARLL